MTLDDVLATVIQFKEELLNDSTDTLDNETSVWLCEKLIAYDEAIRTALELVRRFPCNHIAALNGKDNCLRCQTLESIAASFLEWNGTGITLTQHKEANS